MAGYGGLLGLFHRLRHQGAPVALPHLVARRPHGSPYRGQFYCWNVPIIPILALFSIIYGALVCMAQWDLKRLIAYSSVSHMGYYMLGAAAAAAAWGEPGLTDAAAMATNGASLQMFNHGIITGGLFFLVGVIYERAHVRDLGLRNAEGSERRSLEGRAGTVACWQRSSPRYGRPDRPGGR